MNTDFVIIGGGAAGLMAGAQAGELGIRAVVVERKHKPGRKMLLCGNNRCNITHDSDTAGMLAAYGPPVADFLAPALHAFPPTALRKWMSRNGLRTVVHPDGRVYPRSEKADDVLHFFADRLRDEGVPMVVNCAVSGIRCESGGFRVLTRRLDLRCSHVLIATGGVSYPKTGSVGDGQRFAKALGHRIMPYRAGLAGFEFEEKWVHRFRDVSFEDTLVRILVDGEAKGETSGEILCSRRAVRGPAMVNASRVIARRELRNYTFEIDLRPRTGAEELARQILERTPAEGALLSKVLGDWLVPREAARQVVTRLLELPGDQRIRRNDKERVGQIAQRLKQWRLHPRRTRPLKEAMVTVGGVALEEIEPGTMASRCCPGLYFAGEVMDIDGPTGGYNLHAAFATARLAVQAIGNG